MSSGAGATYGYNAQNLRTSKTINGETDNFILVGGNVWSDGTTDYLRGIELISNGTQLYLYNIRGDVIQLVGFDGEVAKTYDYDAYGNELQRDLADENPFRYCGEYYDVETGFIYLRARYYDPMAGRFTSVDPIKDGLNWYAYANGNPVSNVDPWGLCSRECEENNLPWINKKSYVSNDKTSIETRLDELLKYYKYNYYIDTDAFERVMELKQYILEYSSKYEIDPHVVAGVIFVEQYYNYDWIDKYGDWVAATGLIDMSIGVGQVRKSTAQFLEEQGYVDEISDTPMYPFLHPDYETIERVMRLMDDQWNVQYVSAYLKYFIDDWSSEYPEISNDPAILGTLYNLGHNKTPHNSPESTWFGEQVEYVYNLMEEVFS